MENKNNKKNYFVFLFLAVAITIVTVFFFAGINPLPTLLAQPPLGIPPVNPGSPASNFAPIDATYVVTQLDTSLPNEVLTTSLTTNLIANSLSLNLGSLTIPWGTVFGITGRFTDLIANSLDVAISGALNIGTSTATSILVGSAINSSLTVFTDGSGNNEVVLPNNSIGPLEILGNSLNFTEFSDSLFLDNTTSLNLGLGQFTINLNSTGNFVIQDNGLPFAQFLNDGSIMFNIASVSSVFEAGTIKSLNYTSEGGNPLTISSGGTNQNILLNPSGTGKVKAGGNSIVVAPLPTNPATPENGLIFYDTATNQFKFFENGSFRTIPQAQPSGKLLQASFDSSEFVLSLNPNQPSIVPGITITMTTGNSNVELNFTMRVRSNAGGGPATLKSDHAFVVDGIDVRSYPFTVTNAGNETSPVSTYTATFMMPISAGTHTFQVRAHAGGNHTLEVLDQSILTVKEIAL